jgi:hypothetical protein
MLAIVSIVGFAIIGVTGVLVGIGKVDAAAFTTLAGTLLGGVVGLMKSSPVTDAHSSPRA